MKKMLQEFFQMLSQFVEYFVKETPCKEWTGETLMILLREIQRKGKNGKDGSKKGNLRLIDWFDWEKFFMMTVS